MKKVSLKNIIHILFVITGASFFVYAYVLNVYPIMDYGYLKLYELYILNFVFLLIIGMSVHLIIKKSNPVYQGGKLTTRAALKNIVYKAFNIIVGVSIAYAFIYYSIVFAD